MKVHSPRGVLSAASARVLSLLLISTFFAAPVCAQRPVAPAKPPAQPQAAPQPDPSFETLLSADSYKLYGEVRNVGNLMSSGGLGEIVDPIIKLAEPPKEFNSIIRFLKTNAEALASSRLLFATWPARTGIPDAFVAIEFLTAEEASKFAPKLETFLPGILPPVPVATPDEKVSDPAAAKSNGSQEQKAAPDAVPGPSPEPPAARPQFVLSRAGRLVFISDKTFKLAKLRPAESKSLSDDQNFRTAHDRFSNESVFLYFNVQLEDRTKPKPSPTPMISEAEREQKQREAEARIKAEQDARNAAEVEQNRAGEKPEPEPRVVGRVTVLQAASPTPTPTKEEEARGLATSQLGNLLDALGFGEPQWPEAVGLALAVENNDYVIRALLIEPPEARKLPLPFVPQLISGPGNISEAPSVLPDNTELFVSASIDLVQTYEGMRKQAEIKAKADTVSHSTVYENGVLVSEQIRPREPPLDAFTQFEKKAGFKIREDLLPALGNELALAGSLQTLQAAGLFNIQPPKGPSSSPGAAGNKDEKPPEPEMLPVLLIAVRDRDAVRRLMPQVLVGLGIGEANLLARTEKREDVEIVNYAGLFAYAFVGNFLIISQTPSVQRVVDAYVNHQTLGSNNVFRNSRRWEPRQNLGEVYVSPALMEGYHDEVRKQSATMDPAIRDFLLALDPTSSAITYAMSNEGLGNQHEIHLPKNLIITMVAGISAATKNPPPEANEMVAASALQMIANAEQSYKEGVGKGSYATMEKLIEAKLFPVELIGKYGYNYEITVMGDQFEAVATPREYSKTGKRSFFVDKSGVVRGDDHGGGPATIADKPIQ